MKLIQRLLKRTRPHSGQNRKIRGLSTAELVGIIVIVGILGALGGTYINGLVSQANLNAGKQNANTLNSTFSSAVAGGAIIGSPGCSVTGGSPDTIDTTSITTAIADLNHGVIINGVTYKMNPQINLTTNASSAHNYLMSGGGSGVTTPDAIFSFNTAGGFSP